MEGYLVLISAADLEGKRLLAKGIYGVKKSWKK